MSSPSILDSKVDSSPFLLSYKSLPVSKSKKINLFSFSSLHHHSSHPKDDSSSSSMNKEILGHHKTSYFPFSKTILESTLETCKSCSSSRLGASSCSMSKAKSAKILTLPSRINPRHLIPPTPLVLLHLESRV